MPICTNDGGSRQQLTVSPPEERTPPHNIEAEQALLGAILIYNDVLGAVLGVVKPEHFFEPLHGRIYEHIKSLSQIGRAITPLTLAPFVANEPPIGNLTAAQYLGRLAAAATTFINAKSYAEVIFEAAMRRDMIALGENLADSCYNQSEPVLMVGAKASDALTTIMVPSSGRGSVFSVGEAAANLIERIKRKEKPNVIATGLVDLDRSLGGGIRRGEGTLSAARPSMGKSALAAQIGLNVARRNEPVLMFSLEMSAEVVTARCLSSWAYNSLSPIKFADILSGNVQDGEQYRLEELEQEFESLPFVVDEKASPSMAEIMARSRLHANKLARDGKKLALIILDLLGKVSTAESHYRGQKNNEIGELSCAIPVIAKELDVGMLVFHQLSRKTEERETKFPELQDLRDSGTLEQDADVVFFLHRRAYYLERLRYDDQEKEAARVTALEACRNEMACVLAKNRNGPCKTIELFASIENNAIRNKAA